MFSELSFGLFTDPDDVVEHFNRLLRVIELRPHEYPFSGWLLVLEAAECNPSRQQAF